MNRKRRGVELEVEVRPAFTTSPPANQLGEIPVSSRTRRWVRQFAASILRRAPSFRGRQRIGVLVNRLFWPSADDAITVAPMRLGYKMIIDLRSYTEYRSYYTGDYEAPAVLRAIRHILTSESVVVDVGANVGFMAVPLAQAVYPRGSMFAFEPQRQNFLRLQENLRLNGVLVSNTVFRLGLSDRAATAQLTLRQDFRSGAATGNAAIVERNEGFDSEQIQLDSLDEVFPRLNCTRLDFIKVDIEGHEIAFLRGASSVIQNYRPIIFSEINDWYYALSGAESTALFTAWAEQNDYTIAGFRSGRLELIKLEQKENLQIDVFLVPQEKLAWFLRAVKGSGA